jgi:hypothetical protein
MKKLKDQQNARDAEATSQFEKTGPEALNEMKRLLYEPAVVMRNDE